MLFFCEAEDGIRDRVRSRGLGDVYKRQDKDCTKMWEAGIDSVHTYLREEVNGGLWYGHADICLLYTSDAADERSSVDLGGRRIIKKKKLCRYRGVRVRNTQMKDTKGEMNAD